MTKIRPISECSICNKWMRTDYLQEHSKIHTYSTIICIDLEEEEANQIEEIASEAVDFSYCIDLEEEEIASEAVNLLEKTLLRNNKLYLEKLELGKKISAILDKGVVREGSLIKEHRIALNIYID